MGDLRGTSGARPGRAVSESRAIMEAAKRIAALLEENNRLKAENKELSETLEAHEAGLEKIKSIQERKK